MLKHETKISYDLKTTSVKRILTLLLRQLLAKRAKLGLFFLCYCTKGSNLFVFNRELVHYFLVDILGSLLHKGIQRQEYKLRKAAV